MKTETFTVQSEERLDVFLTGKIGALSRSGIKKLIEQGYVSVNGSVRTNCRAVKAGDNITVTARELKSLAAAPEDIDIEIVYEDNDLAVINKPQGMTVHAGSGTSGGTLVNALLYKLNSLSGINGVIRPGIVHRIDKDTSGLLIVAKNDAAHLSLAAQISSKRCKRYYIALLDGVVKENSGSIDQRIGRHPAERVKMAVTQNGRNALTHYKVLKRFAAHTLCMFELKTGRTHQIRVHAKFMGNPVTGDKVYGAKRQKFNLDGQLLHAYKLEFTHPITGNAMVFTARLPGYFINVIKKLN